LPEDEVERRRMVDNDNKKLMEWFFRTSDALIKAEELIEKQNQTLETIVLKTIEILAKEISNK